MRLRTVISTVIILVRLVLDHFEKNPISAKNLKTGFWAFLTLAGIPSAAHNKIKNENFEPI